MLKWNKIKQNEYKLIINWFKITSKLVQNFQKKVTSSEKHNINNKKNSKLLQILQNFQNFQKFQKF